MACQLHRVTSGQSNCHMTHKQMHIYVYIYICNPFSGQIHKINPYTTIKQNMCIGFVYICKYMCIKQNTRHTFKNVSSFNITPKEKEKRHIRLGHTDHFI